MHLYHGTSTEHLDRILAEGIQPRAKTGRASNWESDVPTRIDFVWLTAAFAVYYAVEAAGEDHDAVLLKIDWEQLDLYPDEDFIANHRMKEQTNEAWNAERAVIDPKDYKPLWRLSLDRSGNVAARSVPLEAIIDHRIVPIEGNGMLLMDTGLDTTPTDVSYPCRGEYFRRCLDAYFQHELSAMPAVVERIYEETERQLLGDEGFEAMQETLARHLSQLAERSGQRS